MYVTQKRTAFLIVIIIVFLAACGPSHPSEATTTVTAPETPLPSPQALDLGVFGKGSASSVEWSPDGKMLAVGSSAGGYIYDTKFEIRDPDTLTLLKEIPIHPNFLAFSPDGSTLAISLTDGRIEYWGWQ